jgi:hypothetical protein
MKRHDAPIALKQSDFDQVSPNKTGQKWHKFMSENESESDFRTA